MPLTVIIVLQTNLNMGKTNTDNATDIQFCLYLTEIIHLWWECLEKDKEFNDIVVEIDRSSGLLVVTMTTLSRRQI